MLLLLEGVMYEYLAQKEREKETTGDRFSEFCTSLITRSEKKYKFYNYVIINYYFYIINVRLCLIGKLGITGDEITTLVLHLESGKIFHHFF